MGIAAGVLLAPVLVSRMRPVSAITVGLSASAVGMAFLARVGGTGELVAVAVSVAVVAFGVGPLFALGTGSVVSSAPPATAGAAASLSETSNVLGSTLGLALLGTVGTAIYRNQLADEMPSGVPAATGDAARETIGGAAAAAADLPAGPAADLVGVAAEAFTRGLNGVAVVGAAAMIGVTIGVRAALRQRGDSTEEAAAFADNV